MLKIFNLFKGISFVVVSYFSIYTIGFLIIACVSVDTLIGLGIFFLFFLFYYFFHKQISKFLLSQTKQIYVFFSKLIYLVIIIKIFVLTLNEAYFDFLWYKVNGFRLLIFYFDFISLKLSLLQNFEINSVNQYFFLKLNIIENFLKNLDMNHIVFNEYLEVDFLLSFDFLRSLEDING